MVDDILDAVGICRPRFNGNKGRLVDSVLDAVALVKSEKTRPGIDEYFLALAALVSSRGTCARRRVGCVLVDGRRHVLATGYNGVAAGQPHCIDVPCPGALLPSGTGLDSCEAIHAEQNALLQCRDVHQIQTCYCTASPCVSCVKLLLSTSCDRIVFLEEYPHQKARDLWTATGRKWILWSR